MVEKHVLLRAKVSNIVANKELRLLRAAFNYGIRKKIVAHNPTDGIGFLPITRKRRKAPPKEDILKVISVADPDGCKGRRDKQPHVGRCGF